MPLSVRRGAYVIPSYTLTGDLLAYLNCGLQYRYHNKGALPPAIPVQRWFGEFIHGVLEEAYRRYRENPARFVFPLPWQPAIWEIEQHIFQRLRAQGIWAPPNLFDHTGQEQRLASRRVMATLNNWGPHLFPLIAQAEVRLKGIRDMPGAGGQVRADYYEVQGIVDVITDVVAARVDPARNEILAALPGIWGQSGRGQAPGGGLEVIVDYKGMRRPPSNAPQDETWQHQEWQVRTYAWLREQQPDGGRVVAGILLYINELVPSVEDMTHLQLEVRRGQTDVMPQDQGTMQAILNWRRGDRLPALPDAYLRHRSMRVVTVDSNSVQTSLGEFDQVVAEIERSVLREMSGQGIIPSWRTRPVEATCTACDARSFCPDSLAPGIRSVP